MGSQTGSHLSRWGDYSAMAIDPSDDCTFWYTNEYLSSNGAFNWKTRIASFQLPGCPASAGNDFSISAIPTSLSLVQGASGSSSLSTAVTSGTAGTVSLDVSCVTSGARASLNPGSVTAGTSATLNVNAGSTAAGTYTLTVTGTEGSVTHTTTVQLTVTARPHLMTTSGGGGAFSGVDLGGLLLLLITAMARRRHPGVRRSSVSSTQTDSSRCGYPPRETAGSRMQCAPGTRQPLFYLIAPMFTLQTPSQTC